LGSESLLVRGHLGSGCRSDLDKLKTAKDGCGENKVGVGLLDKRIQPQPFYS
jgi:hypothetical protein